MDATVSTSGLADVHSGDLPLELDDPAHVDDVARALAWSPAEALEFAPSLQFLQHGLSYLRPMLLELLRSEHIVVAFDDDLPYFVGAHLEKYDLTLLWSLVEFEQICSW